MTDRIGYIVLSKRPALGAPGEFDYAVAGSIWPTVKPCENHQSHCTGRAVERDDTDVEYVIARLVAADAAEVSQ